MLYDFSGTAPKTQGQRFSIVVCISAQESICPVSALGRYGQFAVTVVTAVVIGVPLAILRAPPDPYTQLLTLGLLLVVALPVAYYRSYRGGYESLKALVDQ